MKFLSTLTPFIACFDNCIYGMRCNVFCCMQACPKLIDRFREREENVKVTAWYFVANLDLNFHCLSILYEVSL
jgi:hypothetical protein